MKKQLILFAALLTLLSCHNGEKKATSLPGKITLTKESLKDKIKGGWAGQVIGCSYGGPTEFKYKGAMIQDYTPILWYDDYLKDTFTSDPGLYDDVYMDLTFVAVMNRVGVNAPADSFALAFANSSYKLWHANQNARYNILKGIMPPASGYWTNNPHADDIDFQIESDFAGMISPAMINTAAEICNRTGHITNYGDGYYGGGYMASMYSYAFVSDDIDFIVESALKPIPEKSRFYSCISDVIKWHKQYPSDWRSCWFEVEKKYTSEKGCPEGVFNAFDIDASLNAAYVVIGLLYGNKDFYKTIDIATRCGQDSDCNPATAAGILGVVLGYDKIPGHWRRAVEKVEDEDFPYTSMTLNQVYNISFSQAISQICKNGGSADEKNVELMLQTPVVLPYEESFTGIYPRERRVNNKDILDEDINVSFNGSAIVIMGGIKQVSGNNAGYVARLQVTLDGKKDELIIMPFDYIKRKYDIYYKYQLPDETHNIKIEWINRDPDFRLNLKDIVIYGNTPNPPFNSGN